MSMLPPVRPTRITLALGTEPGDPGALLFLLAAVEGSGIQVLRFPDRVEFVGSADAIAALARGMDECGWPRSELWQ